MRTDIDTAEPAGRPEAGEYAPVFERYVARVPAGDIVQQLETQIGDTLALLAPLPEAMAAHRYAPEKWTVREVVGHLCDSERMFAYRAMRIGRGDHATLAPFDENVYVPAGQFERRTLDSVLDEFATVRAATVSLLRGLPPEAWRRSALAGDAPISVRGLAHVIAGHELHHRAVLQERYLSGGRTRGDAG